MLFRKAAPKPALKPLEPDPLTKMKQALESLDKVLQDQREARAKARRIIDATTRLAAQK